MRKLGSMPEVPRIELIIKPTPLHRLPRMSASLGIDLWIKRDDLTGFAFGGNKGRKLEYLMAEAQLRGADTVVTCGASQSNFVRQLGAACSVLGMKCVAAVMDLPYDEPVGRPAARSLKRHAGNETLCEILNVDLHFYPDGNWEQLYGFAEELAIDLEERGNVVYRIPIGGSSAVGAYAFVQAADEIGAQQPPFDAIVVASSSGSTHTGLAYAFQGSPTRVIGIAADAEPTLVDDFAELSQDLADLAGGKPLRPEDFELKLDYVGPGYGVPSREGQAAIERLGQTEGIFLDPIYSGKAFAGLLDLAEKGDLKGRVLFWHTGGLPALFAQDQEGESV